MNLRVVSANVVVRLKTFRREKSVMFFTLAFPIILVLVFGWIFTKPEHLNFDLPVQDLDQTEASRQLAKTLSTDNVFSVTSVPVDTDPVAYTRTHKVNLLLVIPKGYGEMWTRRMARQDAKASVTLKYIYDPSSTSVEKKIDLMNSALAELNQQASGTLPLIKTGEQSILHRKYRFIEFFVPGIIAMAIMTSSLAGALHINAALRQKGIIRKLATTPITQADWLLSHILYQLALAALSTAVILIVSYTVFHVRLDLNAWLPAFVIVEVFAFVGLGMLMTPLAHESESASAAANAVLFPMMFLSGSFFPVEMMPQFLQKFARVLPLYYVNEGLRASMIFQDHKTAARSLAIIAAVGIVVFAAGAWMTRWKEQ